MFAKRSKAFSFTLLVVLVAVMASAPVASASEPFIGQITMVGFNFAPRGWAFCGGQLLSISQNTALFSLLGTTYGGDGRTTFGLPDLRGRVAVGAGQGPGLSNRTLGSKSGQERVNLTIVQMPSHNHTAKGYDGRGDQEGPADNVWAEKRRDDDYSSHAPDVSMKASAIGDTGGGQAHANMQPFITLNYVIALQGIFPSR